MKFLPNNFTKMYNFWIKTVVLYQKCTFGPEKLKKIVLFTLKMKFLRKIYQNLQILDKNRSFVSKNLHLVPKNGKNCTFYNKNEVFAKTFHQNVQILDKKCSFVPKNVYLVPKKQKNCTFYTKNEVFAKKFH